MTTNRRAEDRAHRSRRGGLLAAAAATLVAVPNVAGADEPARPAASARAHEPASSMPQTCDQDPFHVDYGPIREGALVRLGRHRSVDGNANWDPSMEHYVGRVTAVVAARGLDPQGCPIVEVAVDGGEYVWRVRDLASVADAPADDPPAVPEIRIGLGLVPDPRVYEATFPHPTRRANALETGCTGWIASQPTFTLVLEDDFPTLSILTRSSADAVLVVRTPENEVVCVDDVDGRDPMLTGRATAGRYEVFVGTYEPGESEARFRVALSERSTVRASTLDDVADDDVQPLVRREDAPGRRTRLQPGRVAPESSRRGSAPDDASPDAEPDTPRSSNTR